MGICLVKLQLYIAVSRIIGIVNRKIQLFLQNIGNEIIGEYVTLSANLCSQFDLQIFFGNIWTGLRIILKSSL